MTGILPMLSREIFVLTPSALGAVLSTCSKQCLYNKGRAVHAVIFKQDEWRSDPYLQNHVLNFYAKCKRMEFAQQLFDENPKRNTVTWTALISGYEQCGRGDRALDIFSMMISDDPSSRPNEVTYASIISACSKQENLAQAMQVHSHALRRGYLAHALVSNVLISLYMGCGHAGEAELIFQESPEPDEVSWNSLIAGLSQNGFFQSAIEKFQRMREVNVRITSFALSSAIAACVEDVSNGQILHALAVKVGFESDCFTGCALIRVYSERKNMDDALKAFQMLTVKDVASWNALIEAYCRSGQGENGLHTFVAFLEFGLRVDEITVTAVAGICTGLVMLDFGKQVHSLGAKTGLGSRTRFANSMINMYAKCGNLEDGIKIFRQIEARTVASWTAMIGGLARHGRADEVLQLFEEMKRERVKPNKITYTCILSACGHGGLVDLGRNVFESMEIEPETDHYICMVHLLAGGGRLVEAEEFIRSSPAEYGELLWQRFLVACKNLGEWDRGLKVAEKIMITGLPTEPPVLVLLSNVFATAGRWKEVEKLREKMKDMGAKKEPGCSWIEVENQIQVFGMKKQIGNALPPVN